VGPERYRHPVKLQVSAATWWAGDAGVCRTAETSWSVGSEIVSVSLTLMPSTEYWYETTARPAVRWIDLNVSRCIDTISLPTEKGDAAEESRNAQLADVSATPLTNRP
jgi:hypothetical protein